MLRQFSEMPISELPDAAPDIFWVWVAKLTGAIAGSAISIAYLVPKGSREAAMRFAVGVFSGLIFGPLVGLEISNYFLLENHLTRFELVLMGAATASLGAWWVLGILHRLAQRYGTSSSQKSTL